MPSIYLTTDTINRCIADPQVTAFVESVPFDKMLREAINESVTARSTEALFVFLQSKNCVIVNEEEIKNFLNNHANIAGYLYEAPGVISKKFGDVKLNLELSFDPEIENDDGILFLSVDANMGVVEALDKLGQVRREWLVPMLNKGVRKLNVDVEIV